MSARGDVIDLGGEPVTLETPHPAGAECGRHIGRCRKCKTTVAVDVAEQWAVTWTSAGKGLATGRTFTHHGIAVRIGDTWRGRNAHTRAVIVPCACGVTSIDLQRVKGTVTEHVCNAKCMASKGHVCECACGGRNHGGAYVAAGVAS